MKPSSTERRCLLSDEATIFLVDDDPAALRALAAMVKVVFPHVETFSSAAEFLAAYARQPGCLVLDVAMPGMSGLELHRKLIQDKITMPVIFVTGHANVPMAVEAMQFGAVNFLEKPSRNKSFGTASARRSSWTCRTAAAAPAASAPRSGSPSSRPVNEPCST